jgi:DnaJ-class molecular chaperone
MSTNYYDILGVAKDASEQEIKKAYRGLSLKWHPDRNNSPEAQSKFQEIGQAYETLSDTSKRSFYDDELEGRGGIFRTNSMAEPDIGDIFNMMFGQGGPIFQQPFGEPLFSQGGPKIHIFRQGFPGQGFPGQGFPGQGFPGQGFPGFFQQQLQKPPPIIKNVEITFEQSYTGCVLHIEIDKWTLQQDLKINELEMVYVNVPAGVDQDELIVLRDCGNTVSPDLKGDIKFVVKIASSPVFARHGMDLIHKKQITLKESLTGFSFDLHHVSGKMLCLNNNTNRTIIKPNYRKVISNLGMVRDGNSGNLIIEFDVVFPETLSFEQMTALSQIL